MSERFKTKFRTGKIVKGLIIVCVIASLMGLIGLGKALYLKSIRPEAAKDAAYKYLISNDRIKEKHGDNFSVDFLSVSVNCGNKKAKSKVTVICRINQSEYALDLVDRNNAWTVENMSDSAISVSKVN